MFYHRYQFKPKLLPTIATLILLPLLFSLGFWQLDRMQEKQAALDAKVSGQENPILVFSPDLKPLPYSHLQISGVLLQKFSILLEHQMHNGELGYQVLTPLEITPDLPWVLINRGWISRNAVTIPLSTLSVELGGLSFYPSAKGFILGENVSTAHGFVTMQRIAIDELGQHFQHSFYPYVVLLDPASPAGFVRDWQIKTLPPSKHLGYAVQWFALALTLIALYFIVNLRRKT